MNPITRCLHGTTLCQCFHDGVRYSQEKLLRSRTTTVEAQPLVKRHYTKQRVACPVCKRSIGLTGLASHLKWQHAIQEPQPTPALTSRGVSVGLEKLVNTLIGRKPKIAACPACGKLISTSGMSGHIRWKHHTEQATCPICGKAVVKHGLEMHMSTHPKGAST